MNTLSYRQARVYSDIGAAGRYWVADIYDPTRPAGARIVRTSVRLTHREALDDALQAITPVKAGM